MERRVIRGALVLLVASAGCARAPLPGEPLRGLTPAQRAEFEAGRRIFETVFAPETGLGPLFNANSCAECHEDPFVGGVGDEVELHAAFTPRDPMTVGAGGSAGVARAAFDPSATCDLAVEQGGPVFQLEVTEALREAMGIDAEPIPDGATVARRTIPDLLGFGLLDAVSDTTLLELADPDDTDGDGISGRVNRFIDGRVGRFGRKAFVPTLAEFNDGAFQIEQGITTPGTPDEGTVGGLPIPPGVDPLPEPELPEDSLRLADRFVRFLAAPSPSVRTPQTKHGSVVFARLECASCHVPELRTGPNEVSALAFRRFAPYTDLLLHDMGPELADICFGDATPSEFRTEPLMGLRFSTVYLHDGRASTIQEAVELHGGEATKSRDAFRALSERDRKAILAFLASL